MDKITTEDLENKKYRITDTERVYEISSRNITMSVSYNGIRHIRAPNITIDRCEVGRKIRLTYGEDEDTRHLTGKTPITIIEEIGQSLEAD